MSFTSSKTQHANQLFGKFSQGNIFPLLEFALNGMGKCRLHYSQHVEAHSGSLRIAGCIYFLLMIPETDFGFNCVSLAEHGHLGL